MQVSALTRYWQQDIVTPAPENLAPKEAVRSTGGDSAVETCLTVKPLASTPGVSSSEQHWSSPQQLRLARFTSAKGWQNVAGQPA